MIATLFRYRDQSRYRLHGFVVMPNHVDALLTPVDAIEKAVQLIKGGYSFAVRDQFKGEVWQAGYHAHRVIDAEDYRNQLSTSRTIRLSVIWEIIRSSTRASWGGLILI